MHKMLYSIIIFIVLFIIIFLIHKPFNIHKYKNKYIQFIHYSLEVLFTVQLIVLIMQIINNF